MLFFVCDFFRQKMQSISKASTTLLHPFFKQTSSYETFCPRSTSTKVIQGVGEYQIRRDSNPNRENGDFYIVHAQTPNKTDGEVRVSGLTLEDQMENCRTNIKPIPLQLFNWAQNVNKYYQKHEEKEKIPLHLIDTSEVPPYPYQVKALQKLYNQKRMINALGMGLGKTFVTITFLRVLKAIMLQKQQQQTQEKSSEQPKQKSIQNQKRKLKNKNDDDEEQCLYSLLVIPGRLKKQWMKQFKKFAPELSVRLIKNGKTACFDADVDVIILSDGLLQNEELIIRAKNTLPNRKFDYIAIDECHSMKHHDSKRSLGMYELACKAERLHLISGTPAMTHETTFGLLHLLHPLFVNFHHKNPFLSQEEEDLFYFGARFCFAQQIPLKNGHRVWKFTQDMRKHELEALMSQFRVRMTMEECLPDLPPVMESIIEVGEVKPLQQKEFKILTDRIKNAREKNGNYANMLLAQLMDKTLQLKIPFVVEHLANVLEETDQQFAVFVHHRAMSEAIVAKLATLGIEYININSDIPIDKRPDMIDNFQSAKNKKGNKMRVAIISYGCAAVGLDNLTGINLCFFAERVYDAILVEQSKARFVRIGQTSAVQLIFLDLPDSPDTMLINNYTRKSKSNQYLLGESSYSKKDDNTAFELKTYLEGQEGQIPKRRKTLKEIFNSQTFIDDDKDESNIVTSSQNDCGFANMQNQIDSSEGG